MLADSKSVVQILILLVKKREFQMTADGFHFTFDLLHLLYVLFTHFEVIEKDIFAKLQWQWQVG